MFEMFVLTISQSIILCSPTSKSIQNNLLSLHSSARVSVLSVCVQSFFRVSIKITVPIFTVSGGGGALGLGEALEN